MRMSFWLIDVAHVAYKLTNPEIPSKRVTKQVRSNVSNCHVNACTRNRRKAYRICSACEKLVCTQHSEAIGDKKFRCIPVATNDKCVNN